jgi:DNA-directed RNA polymerase specialized sigma24 family protein
MMKTIAQGCLLAAGRTADPRARRCGGRRARAHREVAIMAHSSNVEQQPPSSWAASCPGGGELTAEALESLLRFLGPDRWSAAREYEKLRARLLRLFEWRGCPHPEELVDRTFDRAARRLAEDLPVTAGSRYALLAGFALRIYAEACRQEQNRWRALSMRPALGAGDSPLDTERRLAALDACLGELDRIARKLLLEYHAAGDDGLQRAQLAEQLGITVNNLRVRAYRLRQSLEGCVRQRLQREV